MKISNSINKLRKIIQYQIEKEKYEEALKCAKTLATILYDYNQIYMDVELEEKLLLLKKAIIEEEHYSPKKNCVFFYDGFGLDLRGWAASYIRTLSNLGYYVIYACPELAKGKIPHIIAELDSKNSSVFYISNELSYIEKAKEIDSIFKNTRPEAAFFYTTPNDVSAAIAFSNNESTTRFQVDLTDHAFWVGVNAFDYTIECREMGASLAKYERGIEENRILKLDCAPYIVNEKLSVPYPFDIYNHRYIFTGGSLYKTLGDKDLLYYKTISHILNKYSDIYFLYAGSGDDSEIKKLITQYPERVYFINERLDFYEIMKHCIIYINSYPMFGGLMMRYAALAHKIPITLKHDHDSDGILIEQDKLGIEFDNYQEYLSEIEKLLSDDDYRKYKEDKISNAVIDEEEFTQNINMLIKEHKTEYNFIRINQLDTKKFREEYQNRYKLSILYKTIAKKENAFLFWHFPFMFFCSLLLRIKEKIFR